MGGLVSCLKTLLDFLFHLCQLGGFVLFLLPMLSWSLFGILAVFLQCHLSTPSLCRCDRFSSHPAPKTKAQQRASPTEHVADFFVDGGQLPDGCLNN